MEKKSFVITLIGLLVLTMGSLFSNGSPVFAKTIGDVEDELKDLEKEQDNVHEKKSEVDTDKQDTDKKIDKNLSKQENIKQEITSLEEKLNKTQQSIQFKEGEIDQTKDEINELTATIKQLKEDIIELQDRIEKRDALLKDRLRAIQKNGGSMKYIEVILGSKSFGEFISRSSAVNTIMDQDKNIMEIHAQEKVDLQVKQVDVEAKKMDVEKKKVALEDQKGELVALKSQLDKQMSKKESLIVQLEEEHDELEDYKLTLTEEQKILDEQAVAIQKAKELAQAEKGKLEQLAREKAAREKAAREKEARERAEREKERRDNQNKIADDENGGNDEGNNDSDDGSNDDSGPIYVESDFIWPVQGRVSSGFGPRIHPISGIVGKLHTGIDIAAPSGKSVKSAAIGVVSSASHGYNGGYGNFIIVTHVIGGKTYSTLYAHLSQIYVSTGQVVQQGASIGAVGSTGDSTGPHLHFEVHPGGYKNPVNPLGYLP
ncbi:peptidoglycan DD-metalloendopeptidase family protein [Ornithinibacillus gellani]|uniref:murein hydrolase activator EnvC family protein n=1 Tax=Ornithinibacillus gellani TaxID=2293253 RepID=UPI000F4A98B9|nr:peptidoglycan DD-metalloendopeptidase family protein [Ornithinibacillus gellani]TQS74815.1 peptidoglycan DD-metalloendopeptidase family protein [Ornithinibacillus gellani]